jgi:hypothetical protein
MDNDAMRATIAAIVDILLSVPDEISLDEVCDEMKYGLGIADDREVKYLTLEAVREMLRRGARVEFDCDAPTTSRYPERTPDEVIARIDREWDALGELPTIFGQICIFEWTPAAMEAYARSREQRSAQ